MRYSVEETVSDLYREIGLFAKVRDSKKQKQLPESGTVAYCSNFQDAEMIAKALNAQDGDTNA